MSIANAGFWEGVFSGGFAAAIASATAIFTRRSGRLARLEQEVAACKRRDARMLVVEAGFRLVVGALARREPDSPELKICRDLLNKHLPLTDQDRDLSGFADVLGQLDDLPGCSPA
ncbi:MAG: hypothetical protein M3N07_03445 [Pseudomonadota bacterium]|nr:hypothetical protein [Pseudomonadota bacterium]